MKKIHTRAKRSRRLSTHLGHYRLFHPGIKGHRPKTFYTEESADAWALKHGLKKEQYCLKKVKHNKKFQIVMLDGENKNAADKKSDSSTDGASRQ